MLYTVIALLELVYKDNVRVDILTTGIGNSLPATTTRQPPAAARTRTTRASPFRTSAFWPRQYRATRSPGNKLTCTVSGLCYYL